MSFQLQVIFVDLVDKISKTWQGMIQISCQETLQDLERDSCRASAFPE